LSNAEGRDEAIYRSSARDARLADLEVAGACSHARVGIAERIEQVSKDALQIGQGSLYPALHRLEYKGWIKAEWGVSENNRRAKFYSLTQRGKKQLQTEMDEWDRLTNAIALVLQRV